MADLGMAISVLHRAYAMARPIGERLMLDRRVVNAVRIHPDTAPQLDSSAQCWHIMQKFEHERNGTKEAKGLQFTQPKQ